MPFNQSTPSEILNRIETELNATIPGSDSRLKWSVESVIARVVAMASHEMLSYISWAIKQLFVMTAEAEYLENIHGGQWGIIRKPATTATGDITITGFNGYTVPAGTIFRRADDVEYNLDADVTIASGTGTGTLTALVAGVAGNAVSGVKVSLVSPVPGIQSDALVSTDGLSGGTDIEGDDSYRDRILSRIQDPPHGGSRSDYKAWARAVSGVTRAWVYPLQYGLGTVGVTFVMDDKPGTIIPSIGEVNTVQNYIEDRREVTADVTVFAPTAVPVNIQINLKPNTVAIQNAVRAEIEDFFHRESEPGGTLYISRLNEAISTATGEFDHVLVAPSANIVRSFGEISTVGTFTWGTLA